jgi:alpha-D-ribose 1-methylphosphonate 5-triphosphate synthase subunit PhnH
MPPSVAMGFANGVQDAQTTFRAVLRALAEPARPETIDVELPDNGLPLAATAILLSVVDNETPLWLSPAVADRIRHYLRFHTGVVFVDHPHQAAFAYAPSVDTLPDLALFSPGTAISPETSTTVMVGVEDFVSGTQALLDGPGFDSPRTLAPAGFDRSRWEEVVRNAERFPVGIDLLLICRNDVVGLPRSTTVRSIDTSSLVR